MTRVGVAALAAALALAPAPAAADPEPAADLTETFATDPRNNPWWSFTGSWAWDAANGAVVSPTAPLASGQWVPGLHYAGTLAARVKLVSAPRGARANASLVFAADPQSGAFRWVKITAGSPGSVSLGQTGTIGTSGSRVIKTYAANVPLKTWIDLSLTVGVGGKVTVKLGPKLLFVATAAPLAPGRIGFAAARTKASFDTLAFRGTPDAEPCKSCHAGQAGAAPAPEVYRYWDGSWWDSNQGGGAGVQQGGHGDPGGRPATTCTGTKGCHDLRLPNPGDHRNGTLEPWERISKNSFHLRSGFISASLARAWDVQTTFDSYCFTACHRDAAVPQMSHLEARDGGRKYLKLGLKGTDPAGSAIPPGVPLDHHLTTVADPAQPLFAPCVTCHDPHGTGMLDTRNNSNRMLRQRFVTGNELCDFCHR